LASNPAVIERPTGAASGRAGGALAKGVATGYLSLVVLLPLAAIAAALGVPVGTLKWRMSEARAALSRALAAEGEAR